jgi:hypothetical protein
VGAVFFAGALAFSGAARAAVFEMGPDAGNGSVSQGATQAGSSDQVPGTQIPPAASSQNQGDSSNGGSGTPASRDEGDLWGRDSGQGTTPVAQRPTDPWAGDLTADSVPVWLDAGDVPTAYAMPKYALRTDFRFYRGGGILGKAYLGLFRRFFVGGAANVPDFVGAGPLRMTRDDAQVLARFEVLTESGGCPALALGWDGPAYFHTEAKGLYVAVSKQVVDARSWVLQLDGDLSGGTQPQNFTDHDLRAGAAMTLSFRNYGAFTNLDQMLDPGGPRWNAGIQATFSPITLGLEFQDMGSVRPDTPVSRLLRLTWNGSF